MRPDKNFWDLCYAEGNTGWDRGDVHPALLKWIDNETLEPCRIILPGCGRGYEAKHLAEIEFDVTAVDYSKSPLEHLERITASLAKRPKLVHQDIFEFVPDEPFDAVYEQTCLCAIEPDRRRDYEQTVYRWLKPNGRLFILMMQCDQLERSAGSLGGPPFHCAIEEMRSLFSVDRWQWIQEPSDRFDHPSGVIFELAGCLQKID
jgi:SAM-dependent methyltransferase